MSDGANGRAGDPAGIAVQLNGEPAVVPAGSTVATLVGASGVSPEARGVAVALDGEVVPRGEWTTTVLRAGARLEVLTAVAGG